MRIYLDMCCLQRPFDDQSQLRIRLETQALMEILENCTRGRAQLVGSDALTFENAANPSAQRRAHADHILASVAIHARINSAALRRARVLQNLSVKPLDALHAALAESAKADYFCTCDDALHTRLRRVVGMSMKVVSPLALVAELEQ